MATSKALIPLNAMTPIVDDNQLPTPYFAKLLQRLQVSSELGINQTTGTVGVSSSGISNSMLAQMAAGTIKGNNAASSGAPLDLTLSQTLDIIGGATWGDILYRSQSVWKRLPAGTSGYFLQTKGPTADPVWAAAGGGGGGTTPTIRSHNSGNYNAASVVAPLPTGTVAGDVVVFYWEDGYTINATPSGWTVLWDPNLSNYTNQACIAKVMTAADITAGNVTLTAGGAYNGVWFGVCITGTSVNTIDSVSHYDSSGSASVSSANLSGFFGVASTDLLFGFTSTRGAMNVTGSTGITILDTQNSANASGISFTIAASNMSVLGVSGTLTYPVANNGAAYVLLAFH